MPIVSRVPSLYRHFRLQQKIALSRLAEHSDGWRIALSWLPTVFRAWRRGTFKPHRSQLGGKELPPRPETDQEFPVFYINLGHRQDRNAETRAEFAKIGMAQPRRVSAIRMDNGALGCALSHVKAVRDLQGLKFELAMICEDDIEFLVSRGQLDEVLQEFQRIEGLSVLCIANRVRGPRFRIGQHLAISNNIQMAACYVVKPHAVAPLLESFTKSANALSEGASIPEFAIDQLWKELQFDQLFFAVPTRKMARQRRSFSDIEKKVKFYG